MEALLVNLTCCGLNFYFGSKANSAADLKKRDTFRGLQIIALIVQVGALVVQIANR